MWPWVLSASGLLALWLVGRKSYWAFIVGLISDVLWGIYSVQSHQLPFIIMCGVYAAFHIHNWILWTRKPIEVPDGQSEVSRLRDDNLPHGRVSEEG